MCQKNMEKQKKEMRALTQDEQTVLERFDVFAKKAGSINKACEIVGINSAVISGLKNGTYGGSVDGQVKKIKDYFDLKDEAETQARTTSKTYKETSISSLTYQFIKNAHLGGGLIALSGDAGIGKTQAAREYIKKNSGRALYIRADFCRASIKPVLKDLCRQLNVSARSNDEMYLGIIDKLSDGMVLIVDEAQLLPMKTIEMLRGLSDHFEDLGQTFGIIFVGNLETINRFGGRESESFSQITSRTRLRPILRSSQLKESDIRLLFPEIEDERSIAFLHEIAKGNQGVRGCYHLLQDAGDNENKDYDGLVAMAKAKRFDVKM